MNANSSLRHKMPDTARLQVICSLCSLLISLALAGCASQQQSEASADGETKQVCLGDVDKAQAMQAAQDTLLGMHFTIEKADTEAGLIRTKPLSGAQFFEFWRKDSVGSFNKAEANLHTIRRTVTLQVSKKDQGMCIDCQVTTQRLNLPEKEVSSSAWTHSMFSQSSASLQKMRLNPKQRKGVAWVDLGKDARLASEVLERIEGQFSAIGGKD